MLFNYVSVIPNCVSQEFINHFLLLSENKTSPATVNQAGVSVVDTNNRVTNYIELPNDYIQNTTNAITHYYNSTLIQIYKQPIKFIEPPQFLYYNVGGKYTIHNDSEGFNDKGLYRQMQRDVTILVYLNEDYEGGELDFPDWGVRFKPKAGTLIAFPSYVDFSHGVLPVTKGKRFSLVSWICTENRVYPRPYQ